MLSNMLTHAELLLLASRIRSLSGLYFSPGRVSDLIHMIRQLAYKLGESDLQNLYKRLLALPISSPEWECFIDILTVGETYFMRESQALSLIESEVFFPLIKARRKEKRQLRIWSAGCCTGEEAYTLAMMLDRMLPDRHAWDIEIIATDINTTFLDKAQKGVYGNWSFRQQDTSYQQRYFKKHDDSFQIRDDIRDMVRFLPHNLSDTQFQPSSAFIRNMDCVLCRNVLIYFHPEDVQAIIGRFEAALNPGGWLVVGASESSHVHQKYFQAHYYPQAILYKKTTQSSVPPVVAVPSSVHEASPQGNAPTGESMPEAGAHRMEPEECMHDCAEFEADPICDCRDAIKRDPLNPDHYRKMAALHELRHESYQAVAAWRRVLYLNPADCTAHIQLGYLLQRAGRVMKARRHFKNALTLLREMEEKAIVPHSDGCNAGEMSQMIHQLLDGEMNA